MKGQASMIDILLLGLFISIVLVGGSVFIGTEELRAQYGREEAVYAQAQLISALNYRSADWGNRTAAEAVNMGFCSRNLTTVSNVSCSLNDPFYLNMQKMLNRTGRTDYNYIFYAEAHDQNGTIGTFTVCNRQPTVCAKHIPAIGTVTMNVPCPDSNYVAVTYMNGIWPSWQALPLACD